MKAGLGESHAKGDLFEGYVARLFSEPTFTIVHRTPSRNDLDGRFIESKQTPDFLIRHNPSRHLIWVECKLRSSLQDGLIQWSEPEQLGRYKDFQRKIRPEKVYVVIGYEGWPTMPESLYCIPLDEIEYAGLSIKTIERYGRPRKWAFS